MVYKELESLVKLWAEQKGILSKATPLAQAKKTREEVFELVEAVEAQVNGLEFFINSKDKKVNTKEEIKDAFGDILVTIIIGAELQGMKLEDCLQSAYNVISKRTGKMVNGQFVKDESADKSNPNTIINHPNLKLYEITDKNGEPEKAWVTTSTGEKLWYYPSEYKKSCEFCITNKGMMCEDCVTTNKPL